MVEKKWTRLCPICNTTIFYVRRWAMVAANRIGSNCKSCSVSKRVHSDTTKLKQRNTKLGKKREPFSDEWKSNLSKARLGKIHSTETKHKIGKAHKNKIVSDETRLKIGKASLGRTPSIETKEKIRKSIIKNIEGRYGKVYPNYNPNSIPILKQKAKELGITDLQHAENGGELFISELGYWVDGYSKEKNIVIEYYEPFHSKQIEKDLQRQTEIENFLKCKFIIIKE